MRIPDGDLMPARRRRYGGGYGRRHQRRVRQFAVLAAFVLAVAAVGLWATRKGSPAVVVARCVAPSPSSPPPLELPRPQEVRLALLNGTSRNLLAQEVANQLTARGFVVLSQGNASAALGGASRVSYGQGALPAARLLAFHVPGAVVVTDPAAKAASVTLVLGGDFRRLATSAEVAAAVRGASGPSAGPAPTGVTPSPTCRA